MARNLPSARRTTTGAIVFLALMTMLVATPSPATTNAAPKLFVIWSPHGLSASAEQKIEGVKGVRDATPVVLGLDWLMRSWLPDGTKVDRPPNGYGFPFEVAVVRPGAFSHFVPPDYHEVVASLKPGQVLMSLSEARLRGQGKGLRLGLRGGRRDVAGVVPDKVTHGYEAITAAPVPGSWSHSVRFFLVRADATVSRKQMRAAVQEAAGGVPLDIKSAGQVKHLRYAPDTPPQATHKLRFGEFPAQPTTSGSFHILSKWVSRHIRTDSVPLLGNVTCHRKLFPQMREALEELQRKGLGHLIRRDEYAGCYNSRFVATPPGVRLSRHSWGIAFDVNTSNNQFGQDPHQDPRLVKIMRKWGLLWGGRWPIPDGMHFEWRRFPG